VSLPLSMLGDLVPACVVKPPFPCREGFSSGPSSGRALIFFFEHRSPSFFMRTSLSLLPQKKEGGPRPLHPSSGTVDRSPGRGVLSAVGGVGGSPGIRRGWSRSISCRGVRGVGFVEEDADHAGGLIIIWESLIRSGSF